ncbi:MAG TPA: hypothetical protein EYN66_21010 [Myxococcales bacterium]|nr:hypothetical protein [Myxococcales bacterium]
MTQSYTYFDPTARWGGTWGGPIKGSINVTVLDTYTSKPIEEAIVIVGPEHPPTLLGYTDSRGQITLSRQSLAGRQIVTAAKPAYSASTIVDMDAKNVTFFLTGEAPSDNGGGGGEVNPLVPGNIDGIVHINSKYMNLPPAQCDAMGTPESGHCTPCQSDSECLASTPHCVTLTDQNPFCTTECLAAADCPLDFECQKSATESVNRCVPTRGIAQVRCYLSNTSLFSSAPSANEDNTVEISTGETAFALKNVRLGDVAVYCVGGSRREIAGIASFTGYVMGIQRHIFVTPGKDMTKKDTPSLPPMLVNISLDIPLTRAVETVVGERPLHPDGPHRTEIKAWLMLGSDGIIPLDHRDLANGEHDYRFTGLPLSLTEELYDAEYAFYAGALSNTSELTPTSEVLRTKLPALDSAPYLVKEGNVFAVKESGYPGDVLDLQVLDSDSVMAVTHSGSVIHFNGLSWYAQPVQRGPTLRGIDRDLAGGIVTVGDQGRILRWNKVGWSTDLSGTQNNLRDVVSTSPTSAIAVGQYVILSWTEGTWTPVSFGPPKDLHAVWGLPGSDLFAVGESGIVVRRDSDSSNWTSVNVPIHSTLRGVFGTASGLVMAVGDQGGCIVKEGNSEFALIETPTEHNLRDLWGRSNTDIYAVGDRATVLHYDGNTWEKLSEGTIESSLRAIHGTVSTTDLLLTMGTHSIHLGPFLGISRFESPTFGEIWDGHSFKWTVNPSGGAEPSFQAFRLYNASNRLFWSIIAPEWVNSFQLPDLAATAGIPMPKAIKRLTGTKVLHNGFKIDEFDIRIYRLSDWRAWSLFGFLFDNPSSVPK